MGKVGKLIEKKKKKMSDLVVERRSATNLKRSKSVRASLRSIGTKLLNTGRQNPESAKLETTVLYKSTSMSNLSEKRRELKKSYLTQSEFRADALPNGILKTPIDVDEKKIRNQMKNEEKCRHIPPKAAQLLHIPTKENYEPVSLRNETFYRQVTNEFDFDYRQNMFQRSSMRLPIVKRRNHLRNSSLATFTKLPSLSTALPESEMEGGGGGPVTLLNHGAPFVIPLPPYNGPPAGGRKTSKKEAKMLQQRLERLAKINIHLHALFAAVEHGHLEKARTILESTDVDVNSVNSDGLTPLDVAILSNNRPLMKMLLGFGAKEGNRFSSAEKLGSHLKHLLGEAEMRLQELGGLLDEPCQPLNTRASFSSIIGSAYQTSSAMSSCAGGDTEKQAIAWGRRAKHLKRLVLGFNQARPPDPPGLVAVDITAGDAVALRLREPASSDSPIATRFKVQWSTRPDFSIVTGETEISDVARPSCAVQLTSGRRYFFRASCGNLKGFGAYLTSTPCSVVPSSWRDSDAKAGRFDGQLDRLERLLNEVRTARPGNEILEPSNQQRRTQRKKTTIKQLFTAASKFHKSLRRGVYLACILYHEDKVLVTNEDFLPVIEVDETYPSCIYGDLHWFVKVSCSWDDVKSLKNDMEKHSSSGAHFRTKLLSAALQMQSSLCLQDLGQLFYKPLRDSQGTVVLSTVNYVKNPKSVSVLNSRWLPLNKVYKKVVLSDDHNVSEMLMASIQEQINYHQVSSLKLTKGLYLAYLKMQSSVDLIQVVVPSKSPNMLPHCKIRDNPHVCAEEWEYLKRQNLPDVVDNASEQQRTFLELVTSAAKRLFNYMDIGDENGSTHRLYDLEVVDLTADVSFIVVCPSAEMSCCVPGQREMLLQRGDLLTLPIQVFEMIHLNTYQHEIVKTYSKLSCFLELDAASANHLHREAFSNTEVAHAKEKLTQLQNFQTKLGNIWKGVRWLMDVIAFARDKSSDGISMRYIIEKEIGTGSSPTKRIFLQIPPRESKVVKSSPGRGSWPGPGGTQLPPSTLLNEFSKSEQHLSSNNEPSSRSSSRYLSAGGSETTASRKNSDSYNGDYFMNDRLPPSKSEDALLYIIPNGGASGPAVSDKRNRSNTVSSLSATTSPMAARARHPVGVGSTVSVGTMNTSDSAHSLSSDSDPLCTSTPDRSSRSKCRMASSRSMTNVMRHAERRQNSDHRSLEAPISNLETSLSKSLNNIKTDVDVPTATYLKPLGTETKKPDLLTENLFKVPFSEDKGGKDQQSGILQVYAAYETGLATGTSLKLHVTQKTTAREVVDLVVKQLNMAVVLKGKEGPIYPAERLKNFCLVAVIGARERCLRDDFRPLQLQNPWRKGRLYVRQKQDVLAALEHSSKHSAII